MLEKKLQEFESELADLFRIPLVNNPTIDTASELSFDDFLQRFAFLDNLLSLEAASQPENSDHFEELGKRLDTLKVAFHDWDATRMKYRTSNGDNVDDLIDGQSICSDCTHTLLRKSDHDVNKLVKKDEANARGKIGKYFGVFGCGVIVGAVCMVKLFGNNGGFGQYQVFLVPPT